MEEIKIVDFEEKYADEIDNIEANEWQADGVLNEFNNGSIVRVALKDTEVIGTIYGRLMGDLFILDVVIIKQGYRDNKLGTKLMSDLFNILKNKNIKSVLAKVVFSNNHMNAEGLMRNFNFKEVIRVKGWWGSKYPDIYCKICRATPCECTCIFFIKELG